MLLLLLLVDALALQVLHLLLLELLLSVFLVLLVSVRLLLEPLPMQLRLVLLDLRLQLLRPELLLPLAAERAGCVHAHRGDRGLGVAQLRAAQLARRRHLGVELLLLHRVELRVRF